MTKPVLLLLSKFVQTLYSFLAAFLYGWLCKRPQLTDQALPEQEP